MTTYYGNSVAYGSGAFYRAEIVLTYSVTNGVATVSWTLRSYHQYSLYDTNNASGSSGDITSGVSGSRSYSDSGSSYKTYGSGTKTFALSYTSTTTIDQTFWIEDLADSSGGGARSTASATLVLPKRDPEVPSAPGTPSASSITGTSVVLSWADPSTWNGDNSSDFDLQVDDSSSFSSPSTYSVLNANSRSVTGLVPGRTYYARVRAKNSAGTGPWSGVRTVSMLDYPSAPGTPSISNLQPTSARGSWATPSSNGGSAIDNYQIQVDDSSGFGSPLIDTTDPASPYDMSGLTPGTTYYTRVRAHNGVGWGPWSSTRSFQTQSGAKIRVSGSFVDYIVWIRVGSTWVLHKSWKRVSGSWTL